MRKLRGSSNPLLALADDGEFYVVKLHSRAPEHRELFNEAAGTILYQSLGLPSPRWTPVFASRKFFDQNPLARTACPADPKLYTGLAFGSGLVSGSLTRCSDLLPSASISRLRNSEMFWLAWLVDACAFHSDNRQAVFTTCADRRVEATFIDHGRMFGGLTGCDEPKVEASRYLDSRLYPEFTTSTFTWIENAILQLNGAACIGQITCVPETWVTTCALGALNSALLRLSTRQLWENILHRMVATLERQKNRNEHKFPSSGNAEEYGAVYS